MNLFTRTLSKIFKSSNQQELDKIKNIIEAINNKENEIKSLSAADFKEKTFNFRKNAQNGSLKIDEIIPEPTGGAHRDPNLAIKKIGDAVENRLINLLSLQKDELLKLKEEKYLKIS